MRVRTKIIQTEEGSALLVPDELKTNEKKLLVNELWGGYIFCPVDDPMRPFRQVIGTFPKDFMEDREQPMLNDKPY